MSDPTQPDGQQPAVPPRFDERSTGHAYTGDDAVSPADDTPQRAERPSEPGPDGSTVESPSTPPPPPADPTVAFGGAAPGQPGAPPPGAYPPGPYPPAPAPGQYPPAQPPAQYPPTQQQPAVAAGPGGPPGPSYGGPPAGGPPGGVPPVGGPPFGGPGGPEEPKKKKSGLLVAALVALVVALVGALGFVALQSGDDDDATSPTTDREEDEPDPTIPATDPPPTDPVSTPPPTEPTTTLPEVDADGSVEGVFVHLEEFPEVIADTDLDATIERIGLAEGNNPVSTVDPVLNLCAAIPIETPALATVTWAVDNVPLSEGDERVFASPADGNCINNSGEALANGAYEVSFTDAAGGKSGVALFTVGSATVEQEFLNDTDGDLCAVELAPTAAGFFQSYGLADGSPLVVGASILINMADLEHEIRGVDCDEVPSESFFAAPGADPISLALGAGVPPTTEPAPQITDDEVEVIDGEIGSLDIAVPNGSADEAVVIDLLLDPETALRIATEDPSLALCGAWNLPGRFEGDMVWEFNREVMARFPVSSEGGVVGRCVPPGGDAFDEGAYQVYLERGESISQIETFTVGRAQTQLGFRNDTGVQVCRVGFSPNLTNWYTFYDFAESADFDESVEPGDTFTIVAPFIENDIRAFDCDGNQVGEATGIPPTDQTLNLSTGTP